MKEKSEKKDHSLDGSSIDEIGMELQCFFEEHGDERKDAMRMAYAAQEVLLKYRARFGADSPVQTIQTARLGTVRFEICVLGEQFNPFEDAKEEDELMHLLLSRMQLAPTWRYKNGCNRIGFTRQEKKKLGPLGRMGLAIGSAIVLGWGCSAFAPQMALALSDTILEPAFNAMMGLITTVAALFIFVSVINSICGLNDMSTLSRIGKTMLLSMMKWLILCSAFTAAGMLLFFTFQSNGSSRIDFTQVYQMFIDIVPTNLLEPMLTGNTLQLLTLSVIFGISILAVGSGSETVIKFLSELETIVQKIILILLNLLPVVIFISIFRLFAQNNLSMLVSSIWIPLIFTLISVAWLTVLVVRVCVSCNLAPDILVKKLLPVFLQGFLTASSAATLFLNMNTCEKKLGINKKLISFGIPMGQVVYMPAFISMLGALMFGIAQTFGMEMTWMNLLVESILAVLLSIAVPPIPGVGVICFTIMLNQLGIPLEGLAIALPLEVLLDHICTGLNLSMLQLELVSVSKKLGMLDSTILHDRNPL